MSISKTAVFVQCLFLSVVLAQSNPEYRKSVDKVKADPTKDNIFELAGDLRGKARYRKPNDDGVDYRIMQETLISIPGHAQHFADLVRAEQEAVKDVPFNVGERTGYDRHRYWYLYDTLRLLPSPETVRVLGEFLSDDRDRPGPRARGQDWGDTPANSVIAAKSLCQIGLRDAPLQGDVDPDVIVEPWREWWAKVKSGEQAFSFEKQEVEYVFQKDGSVMHRPRNGAPRPRNAPVIATPVVPAAPSVTWPYWLSGGLVAAAAVWWLLARRSSPV